METIVSFLRKALILQVRVAPTASSTTQCLHFHHAFSSPLRSISSSAKEQSFAVSHLINSYGFSQEDALSVSKYIHIESPEKIDSFFAFFKSQGFSQTQISRIVKFRPRLLGYHPNKTLIPKLQFFYSKGASSTDVVTIVASNPAVLTRSLVNHIIPSFNIFKDFFQSDEMAMMVIKSYSPILQCDFRASVLPNIEAMQEFGVPKSNIAAMLRNQARTFIRKPNLFREILEKVKKMGFHPSKVEFVLAVHAMTAMTKSTWGKKVDAYKSWGWSEGDIRLAFRKYPWCMTLSVDKIMASMDFFVNKMGRESSYFAKTPILISFSLEKRIIPRYSVVQLLVSKGLIKKDFNLGTLLNCSEKIFLHKYVNAYEEEASQLLKLYQEKINLSKKNDCAN